MLCVTTLKMPWFPKLFAFLYVAEPIKNVYFREHHHLYG